MAKDKPQKRCPSCSDGWLVRHIRYDSDFRPWDAWFDCDGDGCHYDSRVTVTPKDAAHEVP